MENTKIFKIRMFFFKHKIMIMTLMLFVLSLTLLMVFKDSYSKRENDEFSELQTYLLEVKKKDENLHNNLNVREIKKDVVGIDVSAWQKDIDWEKVKNTGIDFVMIRCGYRRLSSDSIEVDSKFEYNIKEANRLGIPVGVYFFSVAKDEKEVIEEASFVLNLIKDYDVTYPIVYDFETYNKNRMVDVSIPRINDNAIRFLEYVDAHGYRGMLYSNNHYLENIWDIEQFEDYKFWLAQYDGTYDTEYDMLQYSDKGKIDGISTSVDLDKANFAYEVIE